MNPGRRALAFAAPAVSAASAAFSKVSTCAGLAALAALLSACAAPQLFVAPPVADSAAAPATVLSQAQPEPVSAWTPKPGWTARRFMVAAANPLATQAGYDVLRDGGSALDAAVAVQMVLALVEPQSSGIGGGALLMHWDGSAVQAWDGRETAPAGADERLFLDAAGKPPTYLQAVSGGRAVATPGAVKMLESAHRQHGVLPWARLFRPAITLAEQGFAVSPRLHALLDADPLLRRDAQARAYFYRADGTPQPVGTLLRNPALAAVLRAIAAHGSDALHHGAIAEDLVKRVQGHAVPGSLRAADLAGYTALQRAPLCTVWRLRWRVCGFPPPSSGHIALMQILGVLDALDGTPSRPETPDVQHALTVPSPLLDDSAAAAWLHRYTEAARLAFADRALHVADPAFVPPPAGGWQALLEPTYLARRAALIGPRRMLSAPAGTQLQPQAMAYAPMADQPEHGTSHISVVDGAGRAVALTTTVESAFGARLMSDGGTGLPGGYLLNNEMTDFAWVPTGADGKPVANRVQPGKRPRSSMSPTLVFDASSGRLLMTLGSPGGAFIIHFVAKALLGSLAWGLDVQRALDLPNFGVLGQTSPLLVETGRFSAATLQALRARGHVVQETALTSGLQAIMRTPDGWFGGADARREGIVLGD